MKIAVITCYSDPDHIRAQIIRAAAKAYPGAKVIVIKNQHRGLRRYKEVVSKLINVRRHQRPDVYVLTFRGQELLPVVLLVAGLKPVIFDEHLVPSAYVAGDQYRRNFSTLLKYRLIRLSEPLYRVWIRHCRFILSDTNAQAELSARTSHVNFRQYRILPAGTDETSFTPTGANKTALSAAPFTVLVHGALLYSPSGIDILLAAAELTKAEQSVQFELIGGPKAAAKKIATSVLNGAQISYQPAVAWETWPEALKTASLSIGMPFSPYSATQLAITNDVYQALASALPVLVPDNEATSAIFQDKINALVLPQTDAETLARVIRWAARHRNELVDIGRGGRKLYEREFANEVVIRQFKNLLDEL